MDGQAPRKDIGKRSTGKPGLQPQWWIELSALALGNGYRRIRKRYRDRKVADSGEIEDCVRRIRPSMDQELRRRKVQLIYQIIGDPECPEAVTIAPELTSDHDNCRPELSDRCGMPRTSALLADKSFLFFDHIYSTSYDTTPKRYLTSFAITRDFFHSFFGTAEDDLDQPTFFRLPRDVSSITSAMIVDDAEGPRREGGIQDVDYAEGPPANQRAAPPPPLEVPLPASLTRPVENTHSAVTTSRTPPMRNARSPDRYRRFSRRGRSASPPAHSHRLGERSNSTDRQRRRDLTSPRGGDIISPRATQLLPAGTRIRDTIFPGATRLLLAGPPIEVESTQATTDEDMEMARSALPAAQPSAEDMEMVPRVPSSAGQLVGKARTDVAVRSRSLDGRRKITQRGRSTSPAIHTHRSERRRERSTSSHRERQRSRGAGTSPEDMEIVQWVPPPRTAAEPLVEHSHSVSSLPAQPLVAPIFSQEVRDRTFSTLPNIQPSAPMLTFSEETMVSALPAAQLSAASTFVFSQEAQSGTVSALAATQPAAAATVLMQKIQDRTISALRPSKSPMVISWDEQLIEDITISLQDASRFIFRRQIRTTARSFMVLSPAGRDRFRVHKADPTDTVSMVNALQLPSEAPTLTLALASNQGKRLKVAAPTTILEKARAQKINMALVVSRLNAGVVIRQLEDFEEPGEELRHKEPQPSLTVNEIVKRNGKPIQISIWDGSNWKIAARNVTYSQTEEKVRFYMLKVKRVRAYDCEGTRLDVEDCFRGAQKDSPPTLYLCLPEQASSAIEL